MSEYFTQVVKLGPIVNHPNADRLEITDVMNGFPCVLGKGEHKEGDLVSYISVDALVDTDRPEFSFLKHGEKRFHRVKAKKLRGIFSMGLVVPAPPGAKEGDDVADFYGIEKYLPPAEREPNYKGHSLSRSSRRTETMVFDRATYAAATVIAAVLFSYLPLLPFITCVLPAVVLCAWLAIQWNRKRNKKPNFPVYDIDGFRFHKDILQPGEPVVITEKIHGCVPKLATITMSDGSWKHMKDIRVGDELLGVDKAGSIITSKVVQLFNNGPASEWVKIKGSRKSAGKGPPEFVLKCTPEHKVFIQNKGEYIEASDIEIGDKISLVRTDPGLSPIQFQVMLGKLLGDGCYCQHTEKSANIKFGHRIEDKDYLHWTMRALGSMCSDKINEGTSGYGSEMVRTTTKTNYWIHEAFNSLIDKDGKKYIPSWIADAITPISLAFWYMDDGSLCHDENQEDRAQFAVCGFTKNDCEILTKGLRKFDINSIIYTDSEGYNRIRLNAEDADKFFLLVAPYIPPSMQRKLPERYRGGNGWIPNPELEYKPNTVTQIVTSIERNVRVDSPRLDMETETHNYFANGVLVHNCNAGYVHTGRKLFCRSRTVFRDGDDNWTNMAKKYDLENVLKKYPGMVLYGEIYGKGVQDLEYGLSDVDFRAFDLMDMVTRKFVDHDVFLKFCSDNGIPTVPHLYMGEWKPELVELAEGQSTIANHVREGMVIRPILERRDPRVGRVILKLCGEGYYQRKGADEIV